MTLISVVLGGFAVLGGETIVDFSKAPGWRPDFGRFAEPAERAEQTSMEADGLHYFVDRSRDDGRGYCSLVADGPAAIVFTWTNRLVRFVMKRPRQSPLGSFMALKFRDAQGEFLQFRPIEVQPLGEDVGLCFRVEEGAHSGETWGTKNLNGKFDGPLRFVEFNFNWTSVPKGEVVFRRLETVSELVRDCRTFERDVLPLGTDKDRFSSPTCGIVATNDTLAVTLSRQHDWLHPVGLPPGPVRWEGPEEMTLRLSRAVPGGDVELGLRDERTKKVRKFFAPWTSSNVVFKTALPASSACYLAHFAFRMPADVTNRSFAILGMDALTLRTKSEAFKLDVETGSPLHLVNRPEHRPVALVANRALEPLPLKGALRVADFWGAGETIPLDRTVAPGETVRIPLSVPAKYGIYRVSLALADGDRTRTALVQFARLPQRAVTPQWPRGEFRFGVNYHIMRYSPKDRALTQDAMVAMGCKLSRSDIFAFGQVCPKEGVYDWAACERGLEELEAHGVSLDAIMYGTPYWARPEEKQTPEANKLRRPYCFPCRPGLYEDYCRRLAARYGTRIAYYEVGNEWDLTRPETLTVDEGIRMQREAMRGLHAGCADVVCIPNGWACALDSRHPAFAKDFQRRMMGEAQDAYDVYPIHLHGPFRDYTKSLREVFRFREEAGIRQPWYSNESALTSVNGAEDAVAVCVWQKMLFAWSHGSTDYIWYNLRGTGFDPSDGEQGYGLMTGDFYPRAGMAAFSAVSDVFGRLSFRELLADTEHRLVGRWEGARDGRGVTVVAGWDLAAQTPCPVRVATDAKRAWTCDLMGNRTPAPVVGGTVVFNVSSEPSAIVFEEATRVVPDAADVAAAVVLRLPNVAVPAGGFPEAPQIVLDRFSQMVELYQADPANAGRTWKGASDVSAKAWFASADGELKVRVSVEDDVAADGDGAVFVGRLPGGKAVRLGLRRVSRDGTTTVYEEGFKASAFGGCDFAGLRGGVLVRDDDGMGVDGWMESAAGLGEENAVPALPKFVFPSP